MNHGQTWTHKIHYGSDLGEATTFPLIVFSVLRHGANTQNVILSRDSQVGARNSQNWDLRDFGGL
jgi:hypothetical protein